MERFQRKRKKKRKSNPTITADPPNIDERKVKNTHDVASSDAAATTAAAAVTVTVGAASINGTNIVAAEATGEDAGDNTGYDDVSSATLVNAPTTITIITTKNKKTKGFLDTTYFPVLQDGSFAISFFHGGINKVVIKPTRPPNIGYLHCGEEFNCFGNIAHHVGDTYPRVIDSANGSKGKL